MWLYTICNVSGMLLMYGGKFPLIEKTNTNSKQFTHGNVDNLTQMNFDSLCSYVHVC